MAAMHKDYDEKIKKCAYKAHRLIEDKYGKGQTEMFKDERFVQYLLYEVFCEEFKIDNYRKREHVVLEYPAPCLENFMKENTSGKSRAVDFAINPTRRIHSNDKIPICIEMKLVKSKDAQKELHALSDLIRLSYMQQQDIDAADHCYFIMFGLKEELASLKCIPYLQENSDEEEDESDEEQEEVRGEESKRKRSMSSRKRTRSMSSGRCKRRISWEQVKDINYCWSTSISDLLQFDIKKEVFCHDFRAGRKSGKSDLNDELCIELIADSTNEELYVYDGDNDGYEDKTGVKVWRVCKPNPEGKKARCPRSSYKKRRPDPAT